VLGIVFNILFGFRFYGRGLGCFFGFSVWGYGFVLYYIWFIV